jgi:hypothetical protein
MKLDWKIGALAVAIAISTLLAFQCSVEKKKTLETSKVVSSLKEQLASEKHSYGEYRKFVENAYKEYEEETDKKIKELVKENSTLKKRTYKEKLRIVKPDGSVVEKEIERSDEESTKEVLKEVQEEYSKRIAEVEEKYRKEYTEKKETLEVENISRTKQYQEERLKLQEEYKRVTKSVKRLRTEGGMEFDKDYYGHLSYSLSPFIIGGGVSVNNRSVNDARIGVGLEW